MYLSWNHPQMNAIGPYWWEVTITLGKGLTTGNIPLPEPMLTQFCVINHHWKTQRQGCIQVSHFKGDFPLSISKKGGSVHWWGGIQYKCLITYCQMWGDLPPLFPKFGGQVANLGGIPPSLALDTTLQRYHQVSNISRTIAGYKIVDHSDVVGASPVGAAPTASSFST